MAKAISTGSASKVTGETEIKDKHGNLLVRFSSEDAETPWGQRYEAARIKYAMLHKGDKISPYLRTGKRPLLGRRIMTLVLERKLKKEVNNGRKSNPHSTSIPEREQTTQR